MITPEQFETQFNKLQAAFSTSKPGKVMDQWFEEFEDCEWQPFQKAMRRCQYGDRFPTWDVFKQQYANCVGEKEKETYEGCGECVEGRVLYDDYVQAHEDFPSRKVMSSRVANCICSRNKIPYLINLDRRKLSMDTQGTYYTARALAHLKGEADEATV
jgi:hypothetical protein